MASTVPNSPLKNRVDRLENNVFELKVGLGLTIIIGGILFMIQDVINGDVIKWQNQLWVSYVKKS